LDFTEETKGLTPQGFIDFLKREYPDLEVIRCGPNWRFGAKGVGNAEFARRCGLAVEEVPFVMHNGEAVSSTRIRKALGEGNVADAAAMLGRPWRISGEVFAGKGEGRKIGFPTLNVRPFQGSVPLRRGVYAVKTELGLGVANWGQAPTMGDEAWKECTLEVHLLGKDCQFDPPKVLSVEFIRFIRPERRFSSITELTRQIEMDVRGCSEN
jgi:riboflavin kinase/FMN adenylyltransferase